MTWDIFFQSVGQLVVGFFIAAILALIILAIVAYIKD
jgi:hypothetical protein